MHSVSILRRASTHSSIWSKHWTAGTSLLEGSQCTLLGVCAKPPLAPALVCTLRAPTGEHAAQLGHQPSKGRHHANITGYKSLPAAVPAGSLTGPRESGSPAPPQLQEARTSSHQHQRSAWLQVHARTQTRSTGFGEMWFSAAAGAAAAAAPSSTPTHWPDLFQRQVRRQQHALGQCTARLSLPLWGHLHTTAGLMSIPSDTQPLPPASDSAQPKPAQSWQPSTVQQHSAASQAGGHGADEAVRDSGSQEAVGAGRIVLYRGCYMLAFRMLVRFKIFQLVGIAALAVPINTFLAEGSVSSIQLVMATSLIIGCGVASTTLWWFSQRYVGEMSLVLPNKLCFSVLDFWGNRQDTVVNINQLIPPMQRMSQKEKAELIHQTLFPLDVSADRQYLISLRHGILVNRPKLVEILTEGRLSS